MLVAVQEKPEYELQAFVGELTFIIPAGMCPTPEIVKSCYGVTADSTLPNDREKFNKLTTTPFKETRYVISHPDRGVLIMVASVFKQSVKPIDSIPFEDTDVKAYWYVAFQNAVGDTCRAFLDCDPIAWANEQSCVLLNLIPITHNVFQKYGVK